MTFYVYTYLRSRCSKYGQSGTPYYVGKGKGDRAFSKGRTIPPPEDRSRIVFVAANLAESEAYLEEKRLIALYGRIDNGTGCLRNLTDGGEGQCGVRLTEEQKEQKRQYAKRLWETRRPDILQAMKGTMAGIRKSPEHRQKLRQANLGKRQSPETIEKRVAHRRGVRRAPFSDEWKRNISEGRKKAIAMKRGN